jgi:hypothetical protein
VTVDLPCLQGSGDAFGQGAKEATVTTAVRFLRLIACLMMLLTLQALGGVFGSPSAVIASSASPDSTDIAAIQSPALAAFPFYDGFESGTLGDDWTISTTNQGRVRVADSSYSFSGTYSLLLDDSLNDSVYSIAAAILTIDLSDQSQVDLDFWCHDFNDVTHPDDGVFISDDGTTWHQVLDLDSIPSFYRHYIIDLDAEATSAGMTLNDHFLIKFQFYEDDPVPGDGFAIDEVQVRAPPVIVPAAFPYHEGFEAGSLGDEWLTDFTNEGRVQFADPRPVLRRRRLLDCHLSALTPFHATGPRASIRVGREARGPGVSDPWRGATPKNACRVRR